MSKYKIVRVNDPVTNIDDIVYHPCIMGGSYVTKRIYTFQSYSTSSSQLSFTTPNPRTFMQRNWKLTQPMIITITGTNAYTGIKPGLIQTGRDALRQFPIASIMDVLDIKLNGTSINLNVADVIKPLLLYNNGSQNLGNGVMSLSPSCPDQSQAYSQLDGSIRNPLSGFFDSNYKSQAGRGAFPYTSIVNSETTATIHVSPQEDLFISPLVFGTEEEHTGFINLQDVEVNITWSSNLSKIWSHSSYDSNIVITDISVEFEAPSLEVTYVTPLPSLHIPRSIAYNYFEINRYVTNIGVVNSGSTRDNFTCNNIQVGAIPRFCIVFARKRNSDFTYLDTDSYAQITNLQVNWNNQNALLASASKRQLYSICQKNQLDLSYESWTSENLYTYIGPNTTSINGIGSVIKFEFGTDIGLHNGECPGLRDTYNLFVQVDIKNNHPSDNINYDFYLITVIPGIFEIIDRTANKQVGILNRSEVFNAPSVYGLTYQDTQDNLMSGGSKFTKIVKKIGKIGLKGIKPKDIGKICEKLSKKGLKYAKAYVGLPSGSGVPKKDELSKDDQDMIDRYMDEGMNYVQAYYEVMNGGSKIGGIKKIRKRSRCPNGTRKRCVKKRTKRKKKGGELISKRQLMDRYVDLM